MRAGSFPITHLIAAGLIGLGMASFVVAKFSDDHNGRFTTESILLELPPEVAASPEPAATDLSAHALSAHAPSAHAPSAHALSAHALATTAAGAADPSGIARTETAALKPVATPEAAPVALQRAQVRPGDSLARILKEHDIPARELQRLLDSKPHGSRLRSIFPGHEFVFTVQNDTLIKLSYSPGPLETLEFERVGDAFVGRELVAQPERLTAYKHGTIDHSLFVASQRAGLDDRRTMRLAHIFQWDIDFVLDIRSGDEFYVLVEELYLGDKFIGYGDILAAEFINQGTSYRAVRYADANGEPGYFAPDGRSVRKAFLRAPVEFSRISSNFNLRRKHPLFNRNMPHRGIDYAAPSGTPILAAGDGKVLKATRSNSNGKFVVLKHGEQFVTKYLHLSNFANGIRSGGRVRQGQVIGYVGATGWATGPHLHYEFLVNGVHKNPRTVALPDTAPIASSEADRFGSTTTPLLALLDNYKQQIQLALVR